MLLLFTAVSVGTGWYILNRPVKFDVPSVMEFDEGTAQKVAEVIEYLSSGMRREVRENAQRLAAEREAMYSYAGVDRATLDQSEARKNILLANLADLYFHSKKDWKLADLHRAEFIAAATEQVKPSVYFQRAAGAAAVLDRFGSPNEFPAIVQRCLGVGALERDLRHLFLYFDHQRLLLEPQIVERLKELVNDPACHDSYRVKFAEFLTSVDSSILKSVHKSIVENSGDAKRRSDSIEWLVENDPTEAHFQLAIDFLSVAKHQSPSYKCNGILQAMFNSEELQASHLKIRKEFVSVAIRLSKKHNDYLRRLGHHGGSDFEPFFRASIESPRNGDELRACLSGIRKLVSETEFKTLLHNAFSKSQFAGSIFDLHVETHGMDESIKTLRSRWEVEKPHWMLSLICKHANPADEAELVEVLEDSFEPSLQREPGLADYYWNSKPLEVLYFLRKFGRPDLARELAVRLPTSEGWQFEDSDESKRFVKWFNRFFELENPLSVREVLDFDAENERLLHDNFGAFTEHSFQLATFDAAGFGSIVDPENWGVDGGLFARICELSGDKFSIEQHDIIDDFKVRLLINERVYQFAMSDNWSWYANAPACDVLNAILERRRLTERFFVFQRAYGNSYVQFVMFANPTKVKGFVEKFNEFKVVPGCEKYWTESQ
jgi:hypothetical protein